jgi:hypothetical protein
VRFFSDFAGGIKRRNPEIAGVSSEETNSTQSIMNLPTMNRFTFFNSRAVADVMSL